MVIGRKIFQKHYIIGGQRSLQEYKDKAKHRLNVENIHKLHPKYTKNIKRINRQKTFHSYYVSDNSLYINLDKQSYFKKYNKNQNILISIPWMTFGGAETLIYNFCQEIKDDFNITFITGLKSGHEWEYKFKEITTNIYHLANLFTNKRHYLEFISNYIVTRNIKILHIIHTNFMFDILPELRSRHPDLKIVLTMFNSRVGHFQESISKSDYIDTFVTDNNIVANEYKRLLPSNSLVTVIPNGIDSHNKFNLNLFDRDKERESLEINKDDLAVFFIGRLSEEKNPDVFVEVAKKILNIKKITKIKFFIIGDGPMRDQINKLLEVIDSKSIKYLGYQSDIARYLSAADVFILPSSIEDLPLSILEAMASESCSLASDVGAVSEVIDSGKDGIVVKAASVKEITDSIIQLRTNSKLLDSIKNKARSSVEEKYSNTILGDNYKKMYSKLLE